jgi:hypothetical protein
MWLLLNRAHAGGQTMSVMKRKKKDDGVSTVY